MTPLTLIALPDAAALTLATIYAIVAANDFRVIRRLGDGLAGSKGRV